MTSRRPVTCLLVVLLLAAPILSVAGQQHSGTLPTKSCTKEVQLRAERASDKIRSWPDLQTYYATYSNCPFDADAAEGLSESIGWLFLNRWNGIPYKALATDAKFRAYVLEGINSTLDRKTLEQIVKRSKQSRCASISASFCEELHKRATAALTEQP